MKKTATKDDVKILIFKEGRKLLDYYNNLIAFYNVANELFIYMDTYADAAIVNMALELRYALDHVVEMLDYIQDKDNLLSDLHWIKTHNETDLESFEFTLDVLEKIYQLQNKLRGAKGHIIRCAYDSFEILCLERLDEIENTINKTSGTVLHSIGLNIIEVYQKIYNIKKEIAEFKIKKDPDVSVDDLQNLLSKTKEYIAFYDDNMVKLYSIAQEQKKEKHLSRKGFIISMIVNTIVSVGVTIGATFLVEWLIGLI